MSEPELASPSIATHTPAPLSLIHNAQFIEQPGLQHWLTRLREGAVAREQQRTLLFDELRTFAQWGLGTLRLPAELGGPGWTVPQLLDFVRLIAAHDPNAAHALRNHFLFVEIILSLPPGALRQRWLLHIADGALLGDANSERTGPISKGGASLLHKVAGGWRLNGRKFYSTGCIYADWLFVTAYDTAGHQHWVMVPAQAPGVKLIDDWDGFGQRLTGSGTTVFTDVFIPDADILVEDMARPGAVPKQGAFAQLYLTTAVAGVIDGILHDATRLLQERPRNFPHGTTDSARQDPLLLEGIGYLSTWSFAASAAIRAAAQAIDTLQAARSARLTEAETAQAAQAASLAAAQAKLLVDDLATRAATRLFDLAGASATSTTLALDRHWRNARTIASHNPPAFKARAIGDLHVNDAPLPRFFF